MSEDSSELRLVGIVGKPHGIKGEVILEIITDYPNTIISGLILFIDESRKRSLEVEYLRNPDFANRKSAILKFKEINSRNDAESIRGLYLYRDESNLPKKDESTFWVDDLIGCLVLTFDGLIVGEVIEVLQGDANDSICIEKQFKNMRIMFGEEKKLYIPLIEEYIEHVDIKSKQIIIKKIPEYI